MAESVAIRLGAPNDSSGNPRRLIVIIKPNEFGGIVIGGGDVAYSGEGEI